MTTGHFSQPTLDTNRLLLRPFTQYDASMVQILAGDDRVAQMTDAIPHPYPDGAAESWIAGHAAAFIARTEVNFAIELRASSELIGAVSLLQINSEQTSAMVGYWIGVPHWGQSYATEAVVRLLQFAQHELQLRQITGRCLARNIASARVMQKAGLIQQHDLIQQIRKNGVDEDLLFFRSV